MKPKHTQVTYEISVKELVNMFAEKLGVPANNIAISHITHEEYGPIPTDYPITIFDGVRIVVNN